MRPYIQEIVRSRGIDCKSGTKRGEYVYVTCFFFCIPTTVSSHRVYVYRRAILAQQNNILSTFVPLPSG